MTHDLETDTLTINGLVVEVRYWIEHDPYPIDDIDGRTSETIVHVEQLWLGDKNITAWLDRFDTDLHYWELELLDDQPERKR